jgi:hypothetical protein
MSNSNTISNKRLEVNTLISKFMICNSDSEKKKIRQKILDIWDSIRILQMEDIIGKD